MTTVTSTRPGSNAIQLGSNSSLRASGVAAVFDSGSVIDFWELLVCCPPGSLLETEWGVSGDPRCVAPLYYGDFRSYAPRCFSEFLGHLEIQPR